MTQASQSNPTAWSLSGGTSMKIVSHGKEDPNDATMMIQLEFKFISDEKVHKVGTYLLSSLHLNGHVYWI